MVSPHCCLGLHILHSQTLGSCIHVQISKSIPLVTLGGGADASSGSAALGIADDDRATDGTTLRALRRRRGKKSKLSSKNKRKNQETGAGEEESSDPEVNSRIVLLVQSPTSSAADGKCMGFDVLTSSSPLQMWPCQGSALDRWSLDEVTVVQEDDTGDSFSSSFVQLRHVASGLCLPENPEHPGRPFACFASSGPHVATGDSINGLVDCADPFAAKIDLVEDDGDDSSGMMTTTLWSRSCVEQGHPVALMSFQRNAEVQAILWGEQVLIENDAMAADNGIDGKWILVDAAY